MSKRIIGLHLLGWLLAGVILIVSLLSAAKQGAERGLTASGLTWYWSKEILPDHLLYPSLMLVDRIALMNSKTPEGRVYMQVNYAFRRAQASVALVQKNKPELALTTMTKAQKYLNQAAAEALVNNLAATDKRVVIKAIEYHNTQLAQLLPSFTTYDQGVLNQLRDESLILEEKLINSIK